MEIPPHCSLTKFSKFVDEFVFSDVNTKHYATTADLYFRFAYFQYVAYQIEMLKNFAPDNDVKEDSWQDSFTFAFGFYALMRTSLQACRRLCNVLEIQYKSGKLKEHRESYRDSIKRIMDVANDIIVHPFAEPTGNSIGGQDHMGAMSFYQWDWDSTLKHVDGFKETTINPGEDLKTVHAYIEGIAEAFKT